jgi:multiple sugar transport system permease protein
MRRAVRRMPWLVALAVMTVWSIFPIYWAVNTSFMTSNAAQSRPAHLIPPHPTLANYEAIFGIGAAGTELTAGVLRSLVNITIESAGATILTIVIAVPAAYAFARMQFRLKSLVFYVVLATLALPVYATLIPLYRIMSDLGLVNTYLGIILVYTSGFLPLAMWIMYSFFSALPGSIEDAALVDGSSRFGAFWRIACPIAAPGIAATSIVTFLFGWGQFIFPLVLSSGVSTEPLTVVLAALEGRHVVPFTLINSAAVIAVAVPALIAIVLNRWLVSGILAGSVK